MTSEPVAESATAAMTLRAVARLSVAEDASDTAERYVTLATPASVLDAASTTLLANERGKRVPAISLIAK
jgi:hypothetical protein